MKFETDELANNIKTIMADFIKTEMELTEKALLKAVEENDFIVGDMAIKYQLESILPKNAKVIYSRHSNPNMIYMIKKLEILKFSNENIKEVNDGEA